MVRRHKKFLGRHKFICAVDGMQYYSEDKRIRWDGAIVYKKNLEPRHPQELIKAVKEDTSVPNPQLEEGLNSDQGSGYTYATGVEYATFALVDESGTQIITEETESIQVPPVAVEL